MTSSCECPQEGQVSIESETISTIPEIQKMIRSGLCVIS
jgi:hypothetical protein